MITRSRLPVVIALSLACFLCLTVTPMVAVSQAAPTITAIATGDSHTCALTSSGGVKCWGNNRFGQLGDGTATFTDRPVDVVGLAGKVTAITAGSNHTCAITIRRAVTCWGSNDAGQVGNVLTIRVTVPIQVPGIANVIAISAGSRHTCALVSGGEVKCWGANDVGQLGNNGFATSKMPVAVAGLRRGVSAIALGWDHSCALANSGGVECWGANDYGQLGDGTRAAKRTPVDVVGLKTGIRAIAAGGRSTCALGLTGGVTCWGDNSIGTVTDGVTDQSRPVGVPGLARGVAAISVGAYHACALFAVGEVRCWGQNDSGELGSYSGGPIPVNVVGLRKGASAIAAGGAHTCALVPEGRVQCWGSNFAGQLGHGPTDSLAPVPVRGLARGVTAIAVGETNSCAVMTGGDVTCWGQNVSGELGDGTTIARPTPGDVPGLKGRAIATGGGNTCALTTSGGVKCWGRNGSGEIGNGTTTSARRPVDVIGLESGVSAIAVGGVTCALTNSGGVKCWGGNGSGSLGNGTTADSSVPVDVAGLPSGVTAITAGGGQTCAVTSTGGVKCWGYNYHGELGNGETVDSSLPVDVVGLSRGVVAIAAGPAHTCAVTSGGGVKCWGYNAAGQLGDGTTTDRLVPVDVRGLPGGVIAVDVGDLHTCVVTGAGRVMCWGANYQGQLGIGTHVSGTLVPLDVVGLTSGVTSISLSDNHTCALSSAGALACWGASLFHVDNGGFEDNSALPLDVDFTAQAKDH